MSKILCMMLVAALLVQLVAMNAKAYTSLNGYSIRKILDPVPWTDSSDLVVDFDAPPQPLILGTKLSVGLHAIVRMNGEDDWSEFERTQETKRPDAFGQRVTTWRYTVYCNGQYVTNGTDTWAVWTGGGGAGLGDVDISARALRSGWNQLRVQVEVESIPLDTGRTLLFYLLRDVQVRVTDPLSFLTLFFFSILLWNLVWKRLPGILANQREETSVSSLKNNQESVW